MTDSTTSTVTPSKPTAPPREVKCVVCGKGSHRLDWQGVASSQCDSHTEAELASVKAKSKAPVGWTQPSTPASKKPEA